MFYLNEEHIYSIIREWIHEHFSIRKCEICGKEYRVTNFPDWVYFGAAGHNSICFECPVNNIPEKKNTLRLIPQLIEICGFIPNSDFSPINHNFSTRVKTQYWSSTVNTIFNIGSWRDISDSWFKLLIEAGVLKDNILVTNRGVKCIAKSGNECNSLDEQFIDNWLFDNGFKPKKEPFYPKHEKYNSSGRRRADWLVNDYYIEYFGLAGDEKYDKKTLDKINLIRELNLKLISIFPEDLNSLDIKFRILID